MNSREKLLSMLVGLTVLLAVVWSGWSRISKMLDQKQTVISTLQKQVSDDEFDLTRGKRASKTLQELKSRSMLSDLDKARTSYRQWLLSVCDEVGLNDKYIKPLSGRDRRGQAFKQIKFQFECKPTLDQATRLLHRLYSSHDLHRIQMMSLKPIKDSKRFELSLTIEGLALGDVTKRKGLGEIPSDRLKNGDVEKYVSTIVNRNLFAPANQAPKLKSISKKTVTVGRSLEVDLEANDPDALDKLTYELVGDKIPEGVEIRTKEGRATIHWRRPKEAGEFTLAVKATDDGLPAKSHSQTFQVVVKDPPPPREPEPEPPPRPRFNDAKFAFVIGTFEFDSVRDVWIEVRTKGEVLKLTKGDKVDVGTFQGSVDRIGVEDVCFKTDEGMLVVEVGQNLMEAKEVEQPVRAAQKDTAQASAK